MPVEHAGIPSGPNVNSATIQLQDAATVVQSYDAPLPLFPSTSGFYPHTLAECVETRWPGGHARNILATKDGILFYILLFEHRVLIQ